MKKLVCIVLALMCFASVAVAATPSKTTSNMSSSESEPSRTTWTTAPQKEALIIEMNVNGRSEAHAQLYQDELDKLKKTQNETGSVAAYFGNVKDEAGNSVSLQEELGTDDVKINEFAPLVVANYEESYGKVRTTFKLPTAYDKGVKVVFLVGIPNAETGEIEWIALEGIGVGEDGEIQVEFSLELLLAIQSSNALMAVASK